MESDERAYPLTVNFSGGSIDLSVPLKVSYTGYFHAKNKTGVIMPRVHSWSLRLINYRQNPDASEDSLQAGQFVLQRPETSYPIRTSRGEMMGYYWIYFTGSYAEQLLADCKLLPNQMYTLQEAGLRLIRQDFEQLFQECAQKEPGYENAVAALLMTILVHLSRYSQTAPAKSKDSLHIQMEKCKLYIQSHFSESTLTVEKIAAYALLSVSRFREVFREYTGMSPKDYIIQQRVNHACTLLKNTNLTVSQIATHCGYQDISHFCRQFHKKTGIAPTDYRKQQGKS